MSSTLIAAFIIHISRYLWQRVKFFIRFDDTVTTHEDLAAKYKIQR